MQRIFLAGERGQLARAAARIYAARGDAIVCAGRSTTDVTDRTAVASAVATFRPDLVVNSAAYTAVDRAEDEADEAFRVNCDGAANLAAAARAANVPIIHISTEYVFDGTNPNPYREDDAPHPLGVYGRSKLAGEQAVAAEAAHHVILRTSWVVGPDGKNFLTTMLRMAGERDEIDVVDDHWGCPTFASDLAAAVATVGDKLISTRERSRLAGIYHASGAGETTWCRFARAIMAGSAARGGPRCRIRAIATGQYPTRARRPANSRLDCSKLLADFGVRFPDWTVALDACLDRMLTQSVP